MLTDSDADDDPHVSSISLSDTSGTGDNGGESENSSDRFWAGKPYPKLSVCFFGAGCACLLSAESSDFGGTGAAGLAGGGVCGGESSNSESG